MCVCVSPFLSLSLSGTDLSGRVHPSVCFSLGAQMRCRRFSVFSIVPALRMCLLSPGAVKILNLASPAGIISKPVEFPSIRSFPTRTSSNTCKQVWHHIICLSDAVIPALRPPETKSKTTLLWTCMCTRHMYVCVYEYRHEKRPLYHF